MVRKILFVFLLIGTCCTPLLWADELQNKETILILSPNLSPTDVRMSYGYGLLKRALEVTIETDGPFKLTHANSDMRRHRVLAGLKTGSISVHMAVTREDWETQSLPIRIPLFKGVLGYRLFLIREENQALFDSVKTLEDLKKLSAGLDPQWTTAELFKKMGFTVVDGNCYECLFEMLNNSRFKYFPRGLNEIYKEFDYQGPKYPAMRIEQSLALFLPTPAYFFVSSHYPLLADRLERGMEILIETGEMDYMFNKTFHEDITRGKLVNRRILTVHNPYLSPETPLDRSELWFNPLDR